MNVVYYFIFGLVLLGSGFLCERQVFPAVTCFSFKGTFLSLIYWFVERSHFTAAVDQPCDW